MTWAEFRIRLHAFRRIEKNEWYKVREISWNALIGSHVNPKKLPKTKEAFIPLSNKKNKVTNLMQERIIQVQKEYFEQRKALENG